MSGLLASRHDAHMPGKDTGDTSHPFYAPKLILQLVYKGQDATREIVVGAE